jgi:hypothetical protein
MKSLNRQRQNRGGSKMKELTIEEIKDLLPDVKVATDSGNRKFIGKVSGRKNRFATVTVYTYGLTSSYEVSWPTVARAYNNNSAIRL